MFGFSGKHKKMKRVTNSYLHFRNIESIIVLGVHKSGEPTVIGSGASKTTYKPPQPADIIGHYIPGISIR